MYHSYCGSQHRRFIKEAGGIGRFNSWVLLLYLTEAGLVYLVLQVRYCRLTFTSCDDPLQIIALALVSSSRVSVESATYWQMFVLYTSVG